VVASAVTFTAGFIGLSLLALSISVTCFSLKLFLDIKEPGEALIVRYWEHLFTSLSMASGDQIIQACKTLDRQERERPSHYKDCLGSVKKEETTSLIQSALIVGYLLQAIEGSTETKNRSQIANLARQHLPNSSYNEEVKAALNEVIEQLQSDSDTKCPPLQVDNAQKKGIDLLEEIVNHLLLQDQNMSTQNSMSV
jgi:hypothetical protein